MLIIRAELPTVRQREIPFVRFLRSTCLASFMPRPDLQFLELGCASADGLASSRRHLWLLVRFPVASP